jgi:peptide/nickel transport system permease protein
MSIPRRLYASTDLRIGTTVFAIAIIVALTASWLAPFDPLAQAMGQRLLPPTMTHLLGTDGLGRDILSRLIYGTRPTLGLVGLVILLIVPIGLALGIVAGYCGGWIERALMGVTDVVMAFPTLVLALAFVSVVGPGLLNSALALAFTGWPAYARLARTETLQMRRSDYLAAAEMHGIVGVRLLWGHVLPACLPSVQIRVALDLAAIILAAAGLSFLGLGIGPPNPEWGAMIADGSKVIFDQWWVAASPGAAVLLLSLGFNLMADGLRETEEVTHD